MKTWLIADTHFGHYNILKFKRKDGTVLRDFNDIHHMNETIVQNWNKLVGFEDKVYHLGDIGFTNFTRLKEVFDRLNGRKVLIKGNHDNFKLSQYSQIFYDVRATHQLGGYILSHVPIHPISLDRWKGNIHGHLHYQQIDDPKYLCVSVERTGYCPISFDDCKKLFDKRY